MKVVPMALAAALVSAAGSVLPAQESGAAACEVRDRSSFVTVVLCPPGLDAALLAEAGHAACAGQSLCGAWIWSDEADLPAEAPAMHDDLTEAQVTSAAAVWIEEQQQLVTIEEAGD